MLTLRRLPEGCSGRHSFMRSSLICSATRYRERHRASGAKSTPGHAHVLAEIVRNDRAHHR